MKLKIQVADAAYTDKATSDSIMFELVPRYDVLVSALCDYGPVAGRRVVPQQSAQLAHKSMRETI